MTQFCVEEAALARLDHLESAARSELEAAAFENAEVTPGTVPAALQTPEMQRARDFAAGLVS